MQALQLGDALVPTAGSWTRTPDEARFTPRFDPVAGTAYAVVARAGAAGRWHEITRVTVPLVPTVASTVVRSIDPGGDTVPANLLRFAVTFSAPMAEGSADGHVHLHDALGADVPGALFAMTPEFWDRDRRRLTVLLEPGRIKRGLQPHLLAGPPLVEGSAVTLVVDPDVRDAAGTQLAAGAHRTYRIGPEVRTRVDPARWEVRWPRGDDDRLAVRFDRPLDRALVRRCLTVVDAQDRPVAGSARLDRAGSVWTFTPARRAVGGRLRIDTRLEDLAGNSVRRVFDRDLHRADGDDQLDAATVLLGPDGHLDAR